MGSTEKWLYTHGRCKWEEYYSEEALAIQKRFYDHFLKGLDNGMDKIPRVRLEVTETMDIYAVRSEGEWPIARTAYQKLYLVADGTLGHEKPVQEQKVTYHTIFGAALFDVTFQENTELTGHAKLRLWVSSETDDMDLIVVLVKINARGEEVCFYGMDGFARDVVARGWLRVSQRELAPDESMPWQPVLKHKGEQRLSPG